MARPIKRVPPRTTTLTQEFYGGCRGVWVLLDDQVDQAPLLGLFRVHEESRSIARSTSSSGREVCFV